MGHEKSDLKDTPDAALIYAQAHMEAVSLSVRLEEAKIYAHHFERMRTIWSVSAFLSWLLTFGALYLVLQPYLAEAARYEVPEIISYVSAVLVFLLGGFACVSSYRAIVNSRITALTKLKIESAQAVERTFGVSWEPEL